MEEIYERYSKLVYKYLYGLCKDEALAEDLTQETFYKAIRGINKFNNECKINTWLYRIAKNVWIDYLKKKKITVPLEEQLVIDNSFENNLEDKNNLINLYKSIHKLDENTREVLYLRINSELSFKDIGNILNKSEEWARIVFYRGKIKLKEDMNNDKK